MRTKNIITLGTLLIFSSNLYAGSLSVKIEGQDVIAKLCNMPQGAKNVTFQISEKGFSQNAIAQPQTRMENGCAIKVYATQPTSLLKKGAEVQATYTRADNTQWSQKASATLSGGTTPAPQPPVPNPPPVVVTPRPGTPPAPTPTPTPAPAPQKQTTPDQKVREYAITAANFMANRVVDAYGPVENFRYWFFEGFKEEARYNSDYRRLPEYSQSYGEGVRDGQQDGLRLGAEAGANAGRAQGNSEAVGRFQRAVNNPAALDTAAGQIPTGEGYGGLRGDKFTPTMAQLLAQNNHLFLDEARRAINLSSDFEDDVINTIFGEYWSLSDYYAWDDYKYDMVFSRWRAENAFELFLNRKLVRASGDSGKLQANNQMLELYRKITNPDEYSDAAESKQAYYNQFINRYNDVIKSKWRSEVYGTKNSRAFSRGVYYHQLALQEIARRAGYEAGFNPTFNRKSIEGYQNAIGAAYKQQFDATVSHYTGHAVIEGVRFAVRNQAGQATVSILDSVLPTFLEATNFGKVDGTVTATLSGTGLSPLPSSDDNVIVIPGLSKVSKPKVLASPAQISASVKPNSEVTVNVQIRAGSASYSSSQQVTVAWALTIKQAAIDTQAARSSILKQYVVKHLLAEWENETKVLDLVNDYQKNPLNTLLGQFVNAVKSLSAAEQQNLASIAPSLAAGIGKRPGAFSKNKGKWDSAKDLLEQIGYKLP
ncbi:MAG: hypothetical protein JNL11_19805 [Bdellovibrionaceae bacterium]|nr:hypothetical protein [Pseudobdellovibrionaceae bacterium]